MSLHDRAAQFMPFKSLKGYNELIEISEVEAKTKKVIIPKSDEF